MLQEGGPLWTAPGGTTLALNNYTTSRFANLLYLEAPACVGKWRGADHLVRLPCAHAASRGPIRAVNLVEDEIMPGVNL